MEKILDYVERAMPILAIPVIVIMTVLFASRALEEEKIGLAIILTVCGVIGIAAAIGVHNLKKRGL